MLGKEKSGSSPIWLEEWEKAFSKKQSVRLGGWPEHGYTEFPMRGKQQVREVQEGSVMLEHPYTKGRDGDEAGWESGPSLGWANNCDSLGSPQIVAKSAQGGRSRNMCLKETKWQQKVTMETRQRVVLPIPENNDKGRPREWEGALWFQSMEVARGRFRENDETLPKAKKVGD